MPERVLDDVHRVSASITPFYARVGTSVDFDIPKDPRTNKVTTVQLFLTASLEQQFPVLVVNRVAGYRECHTRREIY